MFITGKYSILQPYIYLTQHRVNRHSGSIHSKNYDADQLVIFSFRSHILNAFANRDPSML